MNTRTIHVGNLVFLSVALPIENGGYTTVIIESRAESGHEDVEIRRRETQLRHETINEALDAGDSIVRMLLRRVRQKS